jgi:hypothetical protein
METRCNCFVPDDRVVLFGLAGEKSEYNDCLCTIKSYVNGDGLHRVQVDGDPPVCIDLCPSTIAFALPANTNAGVDQLQCGICLDDIHVLADLPCKHEFCESCIGDYRKSCPDAVCPLCRREFPPDAPQMASQCVVFLKQAKCTDLRDMFVEPGCQANREQLEAMEALALRATAKDPRCVAAWQFLGDLNLYLHTRSNMMAFTNPPSVQGGAAAAVLHYQTCLSLMAQDDTSPNTVLLGNITFLHSISLLESGDMPAGSKQLLQAYRLAPLDPRVCFALAKLRLGTYFAHHANDSGMMELEDNLTNLRHGANLRGIYGLLRLAAGKVSPIQSHAQVHLASVMLHDHGSGMCTSDLCNPNGKHFKEFEEFSQNAAEIVLLMKDLISREPHNSEAYQHLAFAHRTLNDSESATAAFRNCILFIENGLSDRQCCTSLQVAYSTDITANWSIGVRASAGAWHYGILARHLLDGNQSYAAINAAEHGVTILTTGDDHANAYTMLGDAIAAVSDTSVSNSRAAVAAYRNALIKSADSRDSDPGNEEFKLAQALMECCHIENTIQAEISASEHGFCDQHRDINMSACEAHALWTKLLGSPRTDDRLKIMSHNLLAQWYIQG